MNVRRIAPLSGIVFVVLTIVAFGALSGSTPGIKSSPEKIATFYAKHYSKQQTAAWVLMLAILFLVVFAASCWPLIRDSRRLWSAMFFGGGLVAAAGFLFAAAVHLALADGAHHGVDPVALQAVNTLDVNSYLAFAPGMGIMMLGAAGALIPRKGGLRYLGWFGLVLGIAIFTPAGFVGFAGAGIWVIAMGIVLFMHAADHHTPDEARAV